ncbi:MAG: hypothetical protein RBS80_15340 [Thermoguttaceae bacterium]|nr:hypothetical protein [Thermoguttaceae bacterium]
MLKSGWVVWLVPLCAAAVLGHEVSKTAHGEGKSSCAWPAKTSADAIFAGRPWSDELTAALAADARGAEKTARQLARRHEDDRLVLEAVADWIRQDFTWGDGRAAASHVQGSLDALSDGHVPKNSDDHSIPRFTWWARKGSHEWVQYNFPEPRPVSGVEVYWFDDRPRGGGCRVPQSWEVHYLDGGEWKPVEGAGPYGVDQDQFNKVAFKPVRTQGLRLAVQLQQGFSSGVLSWKVLPEHPAPEIPEEAPGLTLRKAIEPIVDSLAGEPRFSQALRERMAALAEQAEPATGRQWAELYLDAAVMRRAARLAPHCDVLRRVVFAKHFLMGGSHYAYTEGQSDAQHERHFRPGSALCMMELDGLFAIVRTLIDDPGGVVRDPDVSYDGDRILFAWKQSDREDDYHLHELNLATGERRKLTEGLGYADYEGAYLPDGNIVFNSTRSVQTVDCWWTEVSNLFLCDVDGRFMRQVGFDQVHTNFPTVTCDGRVIYTRWDYNDRGQIYPQGLFQMNPDGTSQRALYGNNSYFPTTLIHARSIPGTGKYVAIFTGHHTTQKGWLGIIDPSRGREENQGAQLIAPVRDTPADRIDRYGQAGDQFLYPYPLSEREFLVSFQPGGEGQFGIYYVDEDGRRELLASDPGVHCNQPIPVRSRPRPTPRPSAVDYRRDTGAVYMQDVYYGLGLPDVERGTIAALRVIALEYRAAGVGSNGNSGPAGGALISTPISIQGAWDVKRVLGTAPVQPDGSAAFEVPARTPIYFQAVDRRGHAVQTMRSWTTLMPGEVQSCVGCHDHKNTSPPVAVMTQAALEGPRPLDEFYGPPRGFSFIQEIQPILNRYCVACHYLDAPPPFIQNASAPRGPWQRDDASAVVPAFSLRGRQTLDEKAERLWSDSYVALAHRRVANWVSPQSAPPVLPPYTAGASQSPVIAMLTSGEHFGVTPDRESMDKLALWIDLLVPYAGDYTEAMNPGVLPRYLHFLEKRRRWQAEEAGNIATMLEYLGGGGR